MYPWTTPFLIWNQTIVPCPVLTLASWPAYRFLKRHFRYSGIPISLRIFHSLLWSTQSKALAWSIKQKQMLFWNSLAYLMIQRMLAIWYLVPLPFLNSAWISGSSWFRYCWTLAWTILSITLLVCEMSTIVQQFQHSLHGLSLRLQWKLTFSSPVATTEFSKFADILSAALSQHHLLGFEIAQLEFHHLH